MKRPFRLIANSTLFKDFFDNEKSGGVLLIFCTLISITIANSEYGVLYTNMWSLNIGMYSITHWINDGLMTLFFLMIGLELNREVCNGELSNFKDALNPVIGALGGMLLPACIFVLFTFGKAQQSGMGIPMATDIAFAVGVLSLLGDRVPSSIKIFLTALAVIDDLGAIVVIALFYSQSIAWIYLLGAVFTLAILFTINRMKIQFLFVYLIGGFILWYFMQKSGVHATISGVLLAFVIPFGDGSSSSISNKLLRALHKPVVFLILPLFALANTAIKFESSFEQLVFSPHGIGVILGLLIGKPLGIFTFVWLAVRLKWSRLSVDFTFKQLIGVSILGGIGFTMSIFIALIAFTNQQWIEESKLAILIGSGFSALIGFIALRFSLPKKTIDHS
jgi:Na+:H+ antiporter, NhaA family